MNGVSVLLLKRLSNLDLIDFTIWVSDVGDFLQFVARQDEFQDE
jgi:hypothetical protein